MGKLIFVFAALALLAAGCDSVSSPNTTGTVNKLSPEPSAGHRLPKNNKAAKFNNLLVYLEPKGKSSESGNVNIQKTSDGKKIEVIFKVTGGIPSTVASQPVDIRSGSCSTPQGIKYSLKPLNITKGSGSSHTILDVSLTDFLSKLPLVIVIYASPTNNTVVSCGQITTPQF